jgi:putative hydrolase of the HAD superfamily
MEIRSAPPVENIKAIFFDVNGTLRRREPHAATQQAAYQRMLELIGRENVPVDYWDKIAARYKEYSDWAQGKQVQLTESEIWTKWLLPNESPARIAVNASELMLTWGKRKGRVVPLDGSENVLQSLIERGYTLGLISNTMSTLDIPGFVERQGWGRFFKVIMLSAFERTRKPAPDLFHKAAQLAGVSPVECAYVGNKFSKDIIGCKRAGYALGIILQSVDKPYSEEENQEVRSDIVIDTLEDLLSIFSNHTC